VKRLRRYSRCVTDFRPEALGGDGEHPVLIAESLPTIAFDHLVVALGIAHMAVVNTSTVALSPAESARIAARMRQQRDYYAQEVEAAERDSETDQRRVQLRLHQALEFWDIAVTWLDQAAAQGGAVVARTDVPPDVVEVGRRARGRVD
jgi:hypothetical protein